MVLLRAVSSKCSSGGAEVFLTVSLVLSSIRELLSSCTQWRSATGKTRGQGVEGGPGRAGGGERPVRGGGGELKRNLQHG